MDDLNNINIRDAIKRGSDPLTISIDPDAATKTTMDIKIKPRKDVDEESLKDEDLEDMMDSSSEQSEEE